MEGLGSLGLRQSLSILLSFCDVLISGSRFQDFQDQGLR